MVTKREWLDHLNMAATTPLGIFRANAVPGPARFPCGVRHPARRGRRRALRGPAPRIAPAAGDATLRQVTACRHSGWVRGHASPGERGLARAQWTHQTPPRDPLRQCIIKEVGFFAAERPLMP